MRKDLDYTRYGLNNPATFSLIGDVKDKTVLDLACGEGYNTRILARRGADVTGVDFSEKMIEYAKQEEREEHLGIRYLVLDALNLDTFKDNLFDLVTCFMALQDIENYRGAISEVRRMLKLKSRFVFSIPHPCFETLTIDGARVKSVDRYFDEIRYPICWNMERLEKQFKTTSFHRTLTDYFNTLNANCMFITRVIEPRISPEALERFPYLKNANFRPQSIIIESISN